MDKFIPVSLERVFNSTRQPVGWHPAIGARLDTLPTGNQTFHGIPFQLGSSEGPCWIVSDAEPPPIVLPITGTFGYLLIVHFSDLPRRPVPDTLQNDNEIGYLENPGEKIADYTLIYQDGTEAKTAIRQRFEISPAVRTWGQEAFAAVPHVEFHPVPFEGPYSRRMWGWYQQGIMSNYTPGSLLYWVYALPNHHPEKPISALLVKPEGDLRFAIAGITIYPRQQHPLKRYKQETFRLTFQEPVDPEKTAIDIDLGAIARRYQIPRFDKSKWLQQASSGLGETGSTSKSKQIYLDLSANPEATLTIEEEKIELKELYSHPEGVSYTKHCVIEVLSPSKTRVHVHINDHKTGQPTPARVHFQTKDGRYLPPAGHRQEVNANFFEDYGGDLLLGETPYAYVDGMFQIELPVGEICAEVCKGFEYMPVRTCLDIQPGQKQLNIEIERAYDWREKGWFTADTHVHFLSPQTAVLEAQAEDVNLVHILASQWGNLYTNFCDFSGRCSGVSAANTLVWIGAENRQHVLGHLSLLGYQGRPILPLCTGGPDESAIGDAVETTLADWADQCRQQGGLAVLPHFPQPYCEAAADIVLGKIDAVEIRNFICGIESSSVREWYHYLNCGYRIAAVGGTDKMNAGIPVGGVRTYAHIAGEELSFASWAKAVRRGRTFTSSGALISLQVEGCEPGDTLHLPERGAMLEIEAYAQSIYPLDELQIVQNGQVIASEKTTNNTKDLHLATKANIQESSWLAARCTSPLKAQYTWPIQSIAAHTSPIYVKCGDRAQFSPLEASKILAIIEGGLTWLDTLAVRSTPENHNHIRDIFQKAQAELQMRRQDQEQTYVV